MEGESDVIDLAAACTATLVQGISGPAGRRSVRLMTDYGTRVVAGVVPGRGGTDLDGIPVLDTVAEVRARYPDVISTVISVAPPHVEAAAAEALDAGCELLVVRAERIAHQAMMRTVARAEERGALVVGGNSLGVLVPDVGRVGNLGGEVDIARRIFTPGPVGVISRSGGNTGTLAWYLSRAGLGQSGAVTMGGDAVPGSTLLDLLGLFESDRRTRAVAYYGELGSRFEEEAAAAIADGRIRTPVVAYLAGVHTRPGIRYGHAGAFVGDDGAGTVTAKRRVLAEAGAVVVDHFDEVPDAVAEVLDGRR